MSGTTFDTEAEARRNWVPPPRLGETFNGKQSEEAPRESAEDIWGGAKAKAQAKEPPIKEPPIWFDDEDWDEAEIPHRPWVVPNYLLRGAVSLIVGPPSVMKSSLALLWATACVLKRSVSRFSPLSPCTCLVYNVEDDKFEQRRRLSATLRQFGTKPADIRGKLRRVGPTTVGTLCVRGDDGIIRRTPAMDELTSLVAAFRPDMFVVDPFSELHNVEENDNTAIRAIVAEFRAMAVKYNMAVLILHHTHKGGNLMPGDPDIARGASAIIGAARIAFTLLNMSEPDAQALGVEKDTKARKRYIRLDGAKSNYAPLEETEWFEKAAYRLDNDEAVAATVPWTPPETRSATQDDLNALLSAIQAGSFHPNAKGLPFSPRLAPGDRSLLPLLEQHGFAGSESQRKVIEQLEALGLEKREFRDPIRREWVKGSRHSGLPAVKWREPESNA